MSKHICRSVLASIVMASGLATAAGADELPPGLQWTTSQANINSFMADAFGVSPADGVVGVALVGTQQAGTWSVVLVHSGQQPQTGATVGQYVETLNIDITESNEAVDLGLGASMTRSEAYVTGLMTTSAGFTAVVNSTVFTTGVAGLAGSQEMPSFHLFIPVQAYTSFVLAERDAAAASQVRNGAGGTTMPAPPNDEDAAVCREKFDAAERVARLNNASDRKQCAKDALIGIGGCAVGCAALTIGWAPCFFGCSSVIIVAEALCMSAALDRYNAAVVQATQDYKDCMREVPL